jgi:hypothetical protein
MQLAWLCRTAEVEEGLTNPSSLLGRRDLGVRTFFPIHEFDNAFGGTKMIAGDLGTVINAGNRDETGSFWNPGVVSAHCCSSPQLFQQIYATGGFISEPAGPAASFVAVEKADKALSSPK